MEIPEGWTKSKIRDVAKIDVGRDLIEERFSKIETEQYHFPVYSNTVEQYGHYGFYSTPESVSYTHLTLPTILLV